VKAKGALGAFGIDAFSPLRGKEYLAKAGPLEDQYHDLHALSSSKGIVERDHNDCMTRDMVLVNLLPGNDRVSIGTVMEIAWAYAYRKPSVVVLNPGNIHTHAMLTECAGYVVETLDEAIFICKRILLP
jgi:nucleoside 2-deoxyribosyltransferase